MSDTNSEARGVPLRDIDVVTYWECPECHAPQSCTVGDIEHVGQPMCTECPDQLCDYKGLAIRREYDGSLCPVCGAGEISGEDCEPFGSDTIFRTVSCDVCDSEWTEEAVVLRCHDIYPGAKAPADYKPPQVCRVDIAAILLPDGRVFSAPRPARHHDLIARIRETGYAGTISQDSQGFLLDDGRFVGRCAALLTAIEAGQVTRDKCQAPGIGLFSEDLW